MSKKLKNWLTIALGLGITAKGVFDLFDDDDDTEDIELSEGGNVLSEEIKSRSKYADMRSINEVEKEEDKNESKNSGK